MGAVMVECVKHVAGDLLLAEKQVSDLARSRLVKGPSQVLRLCVATEEPLERRNEGLRQSDELGQGALVNPDVCRWLAGYAHQHRQWHPLRVAEDDSHRDAAAPHALRCRLGRD